MLVISRPHTRSPRVAAVLGTSARLLLLVLLGASSVACATTEGSFEGGLFRGKNVAFRLGPVPGGWRRIDVDRGSLSFRDDAHGASVLVDARCSADEANTPLVALTQQLLMGTTERSFSTEETIPFDAREARHSVLKAKLDGVPMAYDVYVLKKDTCTYDLVYVAPPDSFAGGAPDFERFVLGFHTVAGGGDA